MLVLRRRPTEAILFDGGLKLTLVGIDGHRAWFACEAPSMTTPVVLTSIEVAAGRALIGVRSPLRIDRRAAETEVHVAETAQDPEDEPYAVVPLRVGQQLCSAGLLVTIGSLEGERAVLELEVADIVGRISVSIFSVTGAEAKIGIDAPQEVRVFREEVWREVAVANSAAGANWSEADLASLSASRRRL